MNLTYLEYIILLFAFLFIIIKSSFVKEVITLSLFSVILFSINIEVNYFLTFVAIYSLIVFKNNQIENTSKPSLKAFSYLFIIVAFGFGMFFLNADLALVKSNFQFELEREYIYVLFAIINLSIFKSRKMNDF